jgi:hypothetical protein
VTPWVARISGQWVRRLKEMPRKRPVAWVSRTKRSRQSTLVLLKVMEAKTARVTARATLARMRS